VCVCVCVCVCVGGGASLSLPVGTLPTPCYPPQPTPSIAATHPGRAILVPRLQVEVKRLVYLAPPMSHHVENLSHAVWWADHTPVRPQYYPSTALALP